MNAKDFSGPLATDLAAFAATLEASATSNRATLTLLRALDRKCPLVPGYRMPGRAGWTTGR